MKRLFVLVMLGVALASCGVRGDPEPPPATFSQAQ
jgi:predicted small lipoprotein YifL